MLQAADNPTKQVTGKFVTLGDERYYLIENCDQMKPFFISVVSASDHWLFISSTGSLSAGRIRPENALFPYKSVDYIHESAENTGSKTILKVETASGECQWEPFNPQHNDRFVVLRNLYKSAAGDKIIFEEINQTLGLTFSYQWSTSDEFGFVRTSFLNNNTDQVQKIEILDGIQNLLPPNAPLSLMRTNSALLDAYKWNELLPGTSLATYSLYAVLSDCADPAESLLATTVFSVTDNCQRVLLSSEQLGAFRRGEQLSDEPLCRGLRGAYLINKRVELPAGQQDSWMIVADIDQSHVDVVALNNEVKQAGDIRDRVKRSVADNHEDLLQLMAGSDAYQTTAEEATSVHHYANVLFNNLRGGVMADQYRVDKKDFVATLYNANKAVAEHNALFIDSLADVIDYQELIETAEKQGDLQLLRLCHEYLPLTFGRRHGDPSRPWNHFEIKLKTEDGGKLLSYQGNWRDIFQNWEALGLSYPNLYKSFIAKFVNASTVDGYNPYRITKDGIDWEMLEEDDPWSNIGYWGDHQIIYLLKFLELSKKYTPASLKESLHQKIFSYANVPYVIKSAEAIFADAKNSVDFSDEKQAQVEQRVDQIGSDGRLVLHPSGQVYQVNLAEKLLVPLLAKLGNLVLDGGIWLNTQRPEWNDANNAIVGNGLSMVTLYYMRRYVAFMLSLIEDMSDTVELSVEVNGWLHNVSKILHEACALIEADRIDNQSRADILNKLAEGAYAYRALLYKRGFSGTTDVDTGEIKDMLETSLAVIDASIASNLREDGLYNAYNIINTKQGVDVELLYPMLEGQVAALSAGVLTAEQAVALLDKLFASEMFRQDQQSFMLYPDRELTKFADKNRIDAARIENNQLLKQMAASGDRRLVEADANGVYHFNPSFENAGFLSSALNSALADYPGIDNEAVADLFDCYEAVFNHKAFTGRSGTMFGYEGLGCIYWHMVSKLLLAVQENYFTALASDPESDATKQLAEYYYKVRFGIGFNKSPEDYGAFPTDPYSHTPKQAGAQQPGMTGQVKEEVITRFGELGLMVDRGELNIHPTLLKRSEVLTEAAQFQFIDIDGQHQVLDLDANSLGFTYCQVPFVYKFVEQTDGKLELTLSDNSTQSIDGLILDAELCKQLFARSGRVRKVVATIPFSVLMD